jgi:hypothetical protein
MLCALVERTPFRATRDSFCDSICGRKLAGNTLFQQHRHAVADPFPDLLANLFRHRQLVPAIAQGHERALKRNAVHLAANLYQPARTEELRRLGPDDVSPSAFARTLL